MNARILFTPSRNDLQEKKNQLKTNVTITWIRRKISFSLIKSIGICLRGSCSFQNDNLEMSLSRDVYNSEFQSSM